MKYYFTFGSEGQIYEGGWIIIIANSIKEAQDKFVRKYGSEAYSAEGLMRYSMDYTEDKFRKLEMLKNGNLGKFCQDVLE